MMLSVGIGRPILLCTTVPFIVGGAEAEARTHANVVEGRASGNVFLMRLIVFWRIACSLFS